MNTIIIEDKVYKVKNSEFIALKASIKENGDTNEGLSKIQEYIDARIDNWKLIGRVSLDWKL